MLIAPQMIRKIIPDTSHLFYDAKGSHISDAIERGPLLCASSTGVWGEWGARAILEARPFVRVCYGIIILFVRDAAS